MLVTCKLMILLIDLERTRHTLDAIGGNRNTVF